jgi:hypothetical protein
MEQETQTTEQIAAQHQTLRDFMVAEFKQEEFADLAYGINGGFAHFTWTTDLLALYEAYRDELWTLARETAEEFGYESVLDFLNTLGGGGHIDDDDSLATWMVWFAAEHYARDLSENPPDDDEEGD